ncbi:GNAT family N-acetyltransferase [Calidithermus terrae]|nr:GNAT family N-acetyltransferase [Calidithermus terrae]
MIRPVAREDMPQLLELLRWMDEDPSRRVLAPEARQVEGLSWEILGMPGDGDTAWVLDGGGKVRGYLALHPLDDELALEGPLLLEPDDRLLKAAIAEARERGYRTLLAFPDESNKPLRAMLEAAGFAPQHTTYFYTIGRTDLAYPPPKGVRIVLAEPVDPDHYREVYKNCEDGWNQRLAWEDDELEAYFADPDVSLFMAYEGDKPVGMAELEMDEEEAEIAYIGTVPDARGKGIGRALLGHAAREAFKHGAKLLRVRAHDHEKAAQELYRSLGFALEEVVVTYALDLE